MPHYRIMTNNPLVADAYSEAVCFLDGTVEDIFVAVRDAVHNGATLISHPLSGSVKPNVSPYKSVLLTTRRGAVDLGSLMAIEDALATLRKFPKRCALQREEVLRDFMVIDLDLVRSALMALPATI